MTCPRQIGPYQVLGTLGRGGAGVVFRARDPALRREVAIKLLGEGPRQEAAQARFRREAEALARLRHPQVVRVHTVGDHQGAPFLVMDLVPGESLASRLEREGPLPIEEAVRIARALCGGLAHVHEQGLVHRDIKPENVLLDVEGRPLLTDFGLVKGGEPGLSREGALLGTPGFWPPEQASGQLEAIGPPSDIYALGATLFVMLTGKPPIEGSSMVELVVATLDVIPPRVSSLRPGVPAALDAVCARCLAKAPDARYPDARAVEAALAVALTREPPGWVRRAVAAGALLLAATVGLSVAWRMRATGVTPSEPRVADREEPAGEPPRSWAACLEGLREGAAVGPQAEAALAQAGRPTATVWDQLNALPAGRERDRLVLLACLLAGRDADAAAAAERVGGSWRQATELSLELRAPSAALDAVELVSQGKSAHRALVDQLLSGLRRARRLRPDAPGPLDKAVARRWQANLAHALARLRACQAVQYDHFGRDAYDEARALAPDTREASYLVAVERWHIGEADELLPERVAALDGELAELTVDADWDPLFVFLRGVAMLEASLVPSTKAAYPDWHARAREAGELALTAAPEVADLRSHYGSQWMGLQAQLAAELVCHGGERLVSTGGRDGHEHVAQAYRLAIQSLLGPDGDLQPVPAIASVTSDWLVRLRHPSRTARRAASLALVTAGNLEAVGPLLASLDGEVSRAMAALLEAEVLLIEGQAGLARERLEAMTSAPHLPHFRDMWGALAHARALTGDEPGAREALARSQQVQQVMGLVWHLPEHLPDLLAGRGWWPGLARGR